MNRKIATLVVIFILLALFCVLALPAYITMPRTGYFTPSDAWYNALQWLKDNTSPDSVVLAWWDYGYWIEYIAQREVLATPSENPEQNEYVARVLNTLAADDEATLNELRSKHKVLYIVVDETTAYDDYQAINYWAGGELPNRLMNAPAEILPNLAVRLFEGAAPDDYILVFDSGVKVYRLSD